MITINLFYSEKTKMSKSSNVENTTLWRKRFKPFENFVRLGLDIFKAEQEKDEFKVKYRKK
jgi:hypothetical protein